MPELPPEPPDNLPDALSKADAAEKARQAALAPPPRPPRAKKAAALDSWLDSMVSGLVDDVKAQNEGTREITLNNAALRIGGYVHLGVDRARAERELFDAAEYNGWVKEQGASHVEWKIKRGIEDGMAKPNERPDLDADNTVHVEIDSMPRDPRGANNSNGSKKKTANHRVDKPDETEVRTLKMIRASNVKSRVPMWVWEYDDIGRIQLGTLTMFAGKPAAGKSTAVRWFAARLSKGELDGVWHGHPMNVALIMNEEQIDAVVVPSLVVANADLRNIYLPQFNEGAYESAFEVQRDEQRLTEYLIQNEVRALFVDPVMSTVGGSADMNRNNEVRQMLAPFTRIAKAINGIVVTVTHLKKGEVRDVLGSVHGSSAFGEVPRAVFGFAPLEDGNHVFEQVKNSAGPMGLKLGYKLSVAHTTADDGQPIELPCFEITGETDVSIADINPNSDETTDIGQAKNWLKMYLMENQPAPSAQTKVDAKRNGDIQPWTLKRAMKELRVQVFSRAEPGKPHTTVWALPDYQGYR